MPADQACPQPGDGPAPRRVTDGRRVRRRDRDGYTSRRITGNADIRLVGQRPADEPGPLVRVWDHRPRSGPYQIGLAATAPDYNNASADVTINVLPYRAPSGTLDVSPAEIWAGERATLSARFAPGAVRRSGCEVPNSRRAKATISGNEFDSSAVPFDPSDNSEQRKTVTLQARVADQKGVTAAETKVVVKKKAVITATRLPDIVFPVNSARVNNCGKRVLLEELKSLIDRDPTGKVVFVGHVTEKEKSDIDRQRAMNAAAVISAGQGICASFPVSQILVSGAGAADNGVELQPQFCGTSATPKTARIERPDGEGKRQQREIPARGGLVRSDGRRCACLGEGLPGSFRTPGQQYRLSEIGETPQTGGPVSDRRPVRQFGLATDASTRGVAG